MLGIMIITRITTLTNSITISTNQLKDHWKKLGITIIGYKYKIYTYKFWLEFVNGLIDLSHI